MEDRAIKAGGGMAMAKFPVEGERGLDAPASGERLRETGDAESIPPGRVQRSPGGERVPERGEIDPRAGFRPFRRAGTPRVADGGGPEKGGIGVSDGGREGILRRVAGAPCVGAR
jgi:hypothetical protein